METKQKPDWIRFQTTLRYTVKDGDRIIHIGEMELEFPPIRIVGVIECKDGPFLFIEQGPQIVKGDLLRKGE